MCFEQLEVGNTFFPFDFWNTSKGLEQIPYRLWNKKIKYKQPRDIFLRRVSSEGLTLDEFSIWDKARMSA